MKCIACFHRSEKNSCSFFSCPKSPGLRNRWRKGLKKGLNESPKWLKDSSKLCSCHFEKGVRRSTPNQFKGDSKFQQFNTPPSKYRSLSFTNFWKKSSIEESELLYRCRRNILSSTLLGSGGACKRESPSFEISNMATETPLQECTLDCNSMASYSDSARTEGGSDFHAAFSTQSSETSNFSVNEIEKYNHSTPAASRFDLSPISQSPQRNCCTHSKKLDGVLKREENLREELAVAKRIILEKVDLIKMAHEENGCLKEDVKRLQESLKNAQSKLEMLEAEVTRVTSELTINKEQTRELVKVVSVVKREKEHYKRLFKEEKCRFHFRTLCTLDQTVSHYTGITNLGTFEWLLSMFDSPLTYYCGWTVNSISKENQLLITLFKLKCNPSMRMLGDWFQTSFETIRNIVYTTWVSALHTVLVEGIMKEVPSRHKCKLSLPSGFEEYENCRMIIDCTEIIVEVPEAIDRHNLVFSNYKKRTTMKGLIGSAPNGTVVFVSDLYPGSTSDKNIVDACGVMKVFEPGDLILADKGFLIKDLLPPGVELNIPPFMENGQLTSAQVRETGNIARARIHIERAIQRVKLWRILDKISHQLAPQATIIWKVCGALANLRKPLIASVAGDMRSGSD